ncbi:hypothetical protein CEXT_632481 [Caerostris extrusa]|uniref:Uncharacterized protein n=1 Tax=Caerostris extrusa TaxID=172846 RepID=A0AAV4RRZ2_CAEEX|nr:hypothetical protein CEXT_632481 [Caerostris extrusa]
MKRTREVHFPLEEEINRSPGKSTLEEEEALLAEDNTSAAQLPLLLVLNCHSPTQRDDNFPHFEWEKDIYLLMECSQFKNGVH